MASINQKNVYSDITNTKNSMVLNSVIIIALFSILAGLLGFYAGDRRIFSKDKTLNQARDAQATSYTEDELKNKVNANAYDLNLYSQVVANLKDLYVDPTKVTDQQLFEGSLKGMVDSIGDPATNYFTKEEYKEYLDSFSSKFEGIGVRLDYRNNFVAVEEVLPNSPAKNAGVEVGYVFYKIDGTDMSKSSVEEIVGKVKGNAGTKVKIVFINPTTGEEVEKEIERASITVASMRLIEQNKDTVVFEVSRFTEESIELWKQKWDAAVNEIVAKGYKNVILDMRGNGGGFLDAAIYAANDFLDANSLIVSERQRNGESKNNKTVSSTPRLKGKNVVILINEGTASASEILAGALRHHKGYKVLGTKSYGKGTVQRTYTLDNGGAIKVTTEYWLLPNGQKLDNENPIKPDTEIKRDLELYKQGKDNIIDEALKLFNQ